ncbi:hypothetical protein CRENBAI_016465 [Crenichthys baileyi]|uniref:Uncharacterized protein n=1 Tax=Crenichthys baileyi TaxID=28760 RepID=A0AAV9SJG4_9TELE
MGGVAASLADRAVADDDAGLLAATLPPAGRETTAPDVSAAAVGDSSSPGETQEGAPRRRFLRRQEDDGLVAGTEAGGERRSCGRGTEQPSLALGRFTLHLFQQQWRRQNLQIRRVVRPGLPDVF